VSVLCEIFLLFNSISLFKQNTPRESLNYSIRARRGREAVAMATKAAAVVITRLLLHRVCGHGACEFALLSPDRRWGHPPLTEHQQREEERQRERNPIMHCTLQGWSRADSSVPVRGAVCFWAHTHPYTQNECKRNTQRSRQVRRLCSDGADGYWFYKMICLCVCYWPVRRT